MAHDLVNEIREEIESLGTETRLIVMIELEPLSDRYVQVMLDKETFNEISKLAFEAQPDSKTTPGTKKILVDMNPVDIPDLKTCYSQEELKAADESGTMQ